MNFNELLNKKKVSSYSNYAVKSNKIYFLKGYFIH